MRLQPTAKFISATALVSAIGLSLGIGQASGAEVALVESVSGRVVAFAAGKPTLLDALDVVSEETQFGPAGEHRSADLPLQDAPVFLAPRAAAGTATTGAGTGLQKRSRSADGDRSSRRLRKQERADTAANCSGSAAEQRNLRDRCEFQLSVHRGRQFRRAAESNKSQTQQ
jgi:hypothetical protein